MSLIELEGELYWDDEKRSADVVPKFVLGRGQIADATLCDRLDALALAHRGGLPSLRVLVEELDGPDRERRADAIGPERLRALRIGMHATLELLKNSQMIAPLPSIASAIAHLNNTLALIE